MAHIFLNRVYHEDTDFVGVVYYANYFKFIERARSESLREVGICQKDLKIKSDISFVVSKVEAHFIKSAKYDDLLTIETQMNSLKGVSVILDQKIFLEDDIIFNARIKLACVNQSGKLKRIPSSLRSCLLLI